MNDSATPFICGVIEGFYGRPWSAKQRRQLFAWMQSWGLNTYLYAPKDDLKHRAKWRELYDPDESAEMKALIDDCHAQQLSFVYGIAPGLDLRYADTQEMALLKTKLGQLQALGCRHFAVLFDDIALELSATDARRFKTFGEAHSFVANQLFDFLGAGKAAGKLWFCPTVYCGRMAKPSMPECAYLREIGERLHPAIDILWTGPEIVSETITVESIRELQQVIKRPPLIWDNLHANDYDLRRLYLGPYQGRALELRDEVRGILSNPNCEFEINFVPLRTLALYTQAKNAWQPRAAYRQALCEWTTNGASGAQESAPVIDLELLGDLFYLPYQLGEVAAILVRDFRWLLQTSPVNWGATFDWFDQTCGRVLQLFIQTTELANRDLCYALYRHLWEVREEVVLARNYIHWLKRQPKIGECFCSDEHRPMIYRSGLVAELQRLLVMDERGQFHITPMLPPVEPDEWP